jgi:hypothetical protein
MASPSSASRWACSTNVSPSYPLLEHLCTGVRGAGPFLHTRASTSTTTTTTMTTINVIATTNNTDNKMAQRLPLAPASAHPLHIAVEWGSDCAPEPIRRKVDSFSHLAGTLPHGVMAHLFRFVRSAASMRRFPPSAFCFVFFSVREANSASTCVFFFFARGHHDSARSRWIHRWLAAEGKFFSIRCGEGLRAREQKSSNEVREVHSKSLTLLNATILSLINRPLLQYINGRLLLKQ